MPAPTYEELLKSYVSVGGFREGLALVVKDGKWFHIRPDGKPAYEQRFDQAGIFINGTAAVTLNGRQLRIRHDGTPAD